MVQIVEKTRMFIQTYGAILVGNGWSLVNNHPLLNVICVSPAGNEILEAIDIYRHTKDVGCIAKGDQEVHD